MSLITSIEVENFMSIEHGVVEFDESNIIDLCGYNDSGKSAFTEAVEILFYDSYSRDQVNFIQDNKDYFRIVMRFDDGVEIKKTKYRNGNGVWELSQAGTVLYTNQLDNAVASVDRVPEVIEKYLGVIMDDYTQSLLNVRRNRDRLLLVGTSGGDNYKIFNSILKSDLLAETSKRLNTDKNKLNTECNNKSNSLQTLSNEIDCMNCAEESSLTELSADIEIVTRLTEQAAEMNTIKSLKEQAESFVDWGEITAISGDRVEALETIKNLRNVIAEPIYDECDMIDMTQIYMLNNIKAMQEQIKGIEIIPKVDRTIDNDAQDRINALDTIIELSKRYRESIEVCTDIEEKYEDTTKLLKAYSEEYNFKICPNCGTVVTD